MRQLLFWLSRLQPLAERSDLLSLIVAVNLFAYFAGVLYWYGAVMGSSQVPGWAWVFIPDCPLFGLLGGLGLLMAIAHRRWAQVSRRQTQQALRALGVLTLLAWLTTYLQSAPIWWQQQAALLGLFSWTLLLAAAFFRQPPNWLLSIIAFGQILYGLWTVTFWSLYWIYTANLYGAPLITAEGLLMTVVHIGLIVQGLFLLTYFTPDLGGTLAVAAWFALSAYVDYGLGYYPPVPGEVPLPLIQWFTIGMTGLLTIWFLWMSRTVPAAGGSR